MKMQSPRRVITLVFSSFTTLCFAFATPSLAATFTVDTTGNGIDSNTGDGICATSGSDCTMRAAIMEANATPGADLIDFDPALPMVGGVVTIAVPQSVLGNLPLITDQLTIDGRTMPGYDESDPLQSPLIRLSGTGTTGENGLWVQDSGSFSRIYALAIQQFGSYGIYLNNANAVVVQGCDLGGDPAVGNGLAGIVLANTDNVFIGKELPVKFWEGVPNVISGNGAEGIWLVDGVRTRIAGNMIGTDRTGMLSGFGNATAGVRVSNSFTASSGNEIGAVESGSDGPYYEGNVISGNGTNGILIESGVTNSRIYANFIGTNADGTAAIANGGTGIVDGGTRTRTGNIIGGRNLISGNGTHGIDVAASPNSTGARVVGNTIGLSDDELSVIGNGVDGILLRSTSAPVVLDNVLAGNGADGVHLLPGNLALIFNNWIGTNVQGDPLGNAGRGVRIGTGGGVTVGGVNPGEPNIIAWNGSGAVAITSSGARANSIRGNSMYGNGGLGIDLWISGVTPNDLGDPDTGTNNLQNFPDLDSAFTTYNEVSGNIEVRYRVDSNVADAFYPLVVDFYLADAGGSAGEVWVGQETYTSFSAGSYRSIAFPLPTGITLLTVDRLVATATDGTGSTSEFSAPVPVPEPGVIPALVAGVGIMIVLVRHRRVGETGFVRCSHAR